MTDSPSYCIRPCTSILVIFTSYLDLIASEMKIVPEIETVPQRKNFEIGVISIAADKKCLKRK